MKDMKKINRIFILMMAVSALAACNKDTNTAVTPTETSVQTAAEAAADTAGEAPNEQTEAEQAQSGTRTVTDMMGREVTLPYTIERAVVLSPADCEILFGICASGIIVGRSEYCDYPTAAQEITTVNSGAQTNIEQIISLEPQVVFMTTMAQTEEQIQQLEAAGIAVMTSESGTIDEIYANISLLGDITGHPDEAAKLTAEMKEKISGYSEKAAAIEEHPTVYFEVSPLEYGLWSCGKGTFMQEAADLLHAENIFGDSDGWISVSEEQVIEKDPDVIVSTSTAGDAAEEIMSRTGWDGISAVKNGKVLVFANDEMTRPGPRVADAVGTLYEMLYGDE